MESVAASVSPRSMKPSRKSTTGELQRVTAKPYTSRIIKASALIADTKTLFWQWDDDATVAKNLDRFRRENLLGKASRSRLEDVLLIFRQRYLSDESTVQALSYLVKANLEPQSLTRVFYFHALQADALLHDIATQVLWEMKEQGRKDVRLLDFERIIISWIAEGKTQSSWGNETIDRVVQGLGATLRDFEVLEGAVNKRLAAFSLSPFAFAYIAFQLQRGQPSGERLIKHPIWHAFFLDEISVEAHFVEAHQRGLLRYYAAGSIIRLEFPAEHIGDYAHVITERARWTS